MAKRARKTNEWDKVGERFNRNNEAVGNVIEDYKSPGMVLDDRLRHRDELVSDTQIARGAVKKGGSMKRTKKVLPNVWDKVGERFDKNNEAVGRVIANNNNAAQVREEHEGKTTLNPAQIVLARRKRMKA